MNRLERPMSRVKAIILAAGRGARMRPLTDRVPKPLLAVRGRPLIEWHLLALARGGVREVVVNTAWLEDRIVAALGDGARFGLRIRYSMEGRDHGGALETAGAIATALPLLVDGADDVFWVVAGDIFAAGFAFDPAVAQRFAERPDLDARLWLVPNPPYHPDGDFGLDANGLCLADAPGPDGRRWTFSSLALARAGLVDGVATGQTAALRPLLDAGMRRGRIGGEIYRGEWHNVGTPAQLAALA